MPAIYFRLGSVQPFAEMTADRVEEGVTVVRGDGKVVGLRIDDPKLVLNLPGILERVDIDPEKLYYEDPHTLGGLKYPFHYDLQPTGEHFPEFIFSIIDRVVSAVVDSAGAAIAGLEQNPQTADIATDAKAAFSDGTRLSAFTAAAFLAIGLLATIPLVRASRREGRREEPRGDVAAA